MFDDRERRYRRTQIAMTDDPKLKIKLLLEDNEELRKEIEQLREKIAIYQKKFFWSFIAKDSSLSGNTFLATIPSQSFHRPDCKWLKDIPANKLVEFSHEEAVKLGYKPCKTCRS